MSYIQSRREHPDHRYKLYRKFIGGSIQLVPTDMHGNQFIKLRGPRLNMYHAAEYVPIPEGSLAMLPSSRGDAAGSGISHAHSGRPSSKKASNAEILKQIRLNL